MRVTINPVFDIETLKLISHEGEYDYDGPVELAKGDTAAEQMALQNDQNANALSQQYQQQSMAEQQQILPFLTQEMNNPQGFGQTGVNEMMTAGGEATAGNLGNSIEQANLRASRTGNPSSSASIIDAASRAGGAQLSNNALNVNLSNLDKKLQQQQSGEQGIAALSGGNIQEALSALGLSNQSANSYNTAYGTEGANWFTPVLQGIGALGQGVGAAAGGILG